MLSKNKIKLITGLSLKKYRDETGLFVAEGTKLIKDLSLAFKCITLVATGEWLKINTQIQTSELIEVTESELQKITNQKNPQGVLAVFEKPTYHWNNEELNEKLCLALDDVQDPGNLGTIIRVADWFGISDIFCSGHSADAYNTKTVQATMGALARVRIHTVNMVEFLQSISNNTPVFGTFMNGEDIYSKNLTQHGIILMGNEGNGISPEIERFVTERLLIPNFPAGQATSESLNVGIATALVCSEFRRRQR
jgi:TrmH family RNA methyltransferase